MVMYLSRTVSLSIFKTLMLDTTKCSGICNPLNSANNSLILSAFAVRIRGYICIIALISLPSNLKSCNLVKKLLISSGHRVNRYRCLHNYRTNQIGYISPRNVFCLKCFSFAFRHNNWSYLQTPYSSEYHSPVYATT